LKISPTRAVILQDEPKSPENFRLSDLELKEMVKEEESSTREGRFASVNDSSRDFPQAAG
jgi:hypothetical protein